MAFSYRIFYRLRKLNQFNTFLFSNFVDCHRLVNDNHYKYLVCNAFIHTDMKCMAGHSKWQNVKHVKAEKDRMRNKLCDKYCRLARVAVREGGPDPKLNRKLADAISEANRHNVSTSTIEGALKRVSGKKIKFGTIEISGPGGCFVILDYETDNESTTRHQIKTILKRHGAIIFPGENGRWRALFEQKGIVKVVGRTDSQPLDSEKALDSAIEAGAEDVQMKNDEDGDYLEFFCSPNDIHSVHKELTNLSYNVEEAYVAYIPTVTVKLSPEDMETAHSLFMELEDMYEIVRIYENVQ